MGKVGLVSLESLKGKRRVVSYKKALIKGAVIIKSPLKLKV